MGLRKSNVCSLPNSRDFGKESEAEEKPGKIDHLGSGGMTEVLLI